MRLLLARKCIYQQSHSLPADSISQGTLTTWWLIWGTSPSTPHIWSPFHWAERLLNPFSPGWGKAKAQNRSLEDASLSLASQTDDSVDADWKQREGGRDNTADPLSPAFADSEHLKSSG
ncbi:hypothetical protein EYF80_001652 [Liparis tanakae]|uniref:Uncharacterized protein n=1 Tax=Liparis tanakae TaxID=230148 RepID=A0A4Z2JDH8_9TELE|nr:hypothetical protein EYF80_001652 [Liparis tanakae]